MNHEGSDNGLGGTFRLGVIRADERYRLEGGLIAGIPYGGLDVGIEKRFSPEAKAGIVLRAGGGLLIEDGFTGIFLRGGGGVEWQVSPRVALRATAQAGYHGGVMGPNHIYVGLDYRR